MKGPAARRSATGQRALIFDAMPERIEPSLALLVSQVPEGPDWSYEVKWDGYRLAVHIEPGGKVRIITRGGHDWTERFPTVAKAASLLGVDSAIIDGEAVVLDAQGRADFSALQKALGGRGGKLRAGAATLYAFDLLYLNGHDLRQLRLDERRALLEGVLGEAKVQGIGFSEDIDRPGAELLEQACALGLEGIIAKKRNARYRSGRFGEWVKIKCVQSETFVIIGYEPSSVALGGIGRLLLAARKGDGLAYVGGVGTGFGEVSGRALKRMMDKLVIEKPVIPLKRKGAKWLTPALAAEIEFRGWTDEPKLRHASFKGLREEAETGEIHQLPQGPPRAMNRSIQGPHSARRR
ncbi:non-homologous end-joining DNA ligase [Bosea sp. BK604]|uniref:non-homologous end-joining DNA ligase n=1 Tax=Bosea sp. BK604 TaxID=2512180 RepID=UPI0020BFDBEA|nr:non-homologous end-joining DNA ligase [Bosea sp. BK604]